MNIIILIKNMFHITYIDWNKQIKIFNVFRRGRRTESETYTTPERWRVFRIRVKAHTTITWFWNHFAVPDYINDSLLYVITTTQKSYSLCTVKIWNSYHEYYTRKTVFTTELRGV